jgi:hypothetical protein
MSERSSLSGYLFWVTETVDEEQAIADGDRRGYEAHEISVVTLLHVAAAAEHQLL